MEVAVIINNLKQAKDIEDLVQAFIVPIKNYSINLGEGFEIEDVRELQKLNKEIFVLVNKNIHNNELNGLKKLLLNLEKLQVKGIIFYDIALVEFKKKLGLKTDLVWAQEHLVTNYATINYWYEKGIKYAYLSSELTKKEMMDIKANTKAKLFINVFGYIPMFTSRRHLVNNYINYFDLDSRGKSQKLAKEGKKYPIVDGKYGTTVYSNYVLNLTLEEFGSMDYAVFNSLMIAADDFKKVLIDYHQKVNNSFPIEQGFLYTETIYKVKKNG